MEIKIGLNKQNRRWWAICTKDGQIIAFAQPLRLILASNQPAASILQVLYTCEPGQYTIEKLEGLCK